LALDYRLAPENPFPAAVEDAVAGYRYLLARGLKSGRIAIAGDSAGGGLVVAAMLAIREARLPQPGCGWCISPWVDMEATGETMVSKSTVDPTVQKAGILDMARLYLKAADPRSPLAAPIHADPTGLAPLLIQVGAAETEGGPAGDCGGWRIRSIAHGCKISLAIVDFRAARFRASPGMSALRLMCAVVSADPA
jgi:acetyl esterase/lipase